MKNKGKTVCATYSPNAAIAIGAQYDSANRSKQTDALNSINSLIDGSQLAFDVDFLAFLCGFYVDSIRS